MRIKKSLVFIVMFSILCSSILYARKCDWNYPTRNHYPESTYEGHYNNAIDIGTPCGTPVYAIASGTVVTMSNPDVGCKAGRSAGYGKYIEINHDGGGYSLYAHLSSISVNGGIHVSKGQQIGISGCTGYTLDVTGCHIHYEEKNANREPINPYSSVVILINFYQ